VQVHRVAKNIIEMEVWQPVKDTPNKLHRLDHAILRRFRWYLNANDPLLILCNHSYHSQAGILVRF
jgi:hypothetical protein